MFRRLILLGLVLGSVSAFAQSQIDIFKWRPSGSFDLQATIDGIRNIGFSGELAENDGSAQVTKERYVADLKSYPGFVTVIISREGDELGKLFILQRTKVAGGKSAVYEQLNETPILGVALEFNVDLAYALKRFAELKKLNNQEPSFAFTAMRDYFAGSDKKFDSFVQDVETGAEVVRVVTPPGEVVAGPDIKPLPNKNQRQQEQVPDDQNRPDPNLDPSLEPNGDFQGEVADLPAEPAPQRVRPRKQKAQRVPRWSDNQNYDVNSYPPPPGSPRPRQNKRPRNNVPPWADDRAQADMDTYLNGGAPGNRRKQNLRQVFDPFNIFN